MFEAAQDSPAPVPRTQVLTPQLATRLQLGMLSAATSDDRYLRQMTQLKNDRRKARKRRGIARG
jgi:hypothetical protein